MARDNGQMSFRDSIDLTKTKSQNGIYLAEVMDTRSPTKSGEIKVWVVSSGTDKNDPSSWIVAKCSSSLYGTTVNNNQNSTRYEVSPTSFGWWNPMPYVGNYVFIFYPVTTGGLTTAYWFGCPVGYQNDMIPGIAYDLTQTNDYTPKCETNYKTDNVIPAISYDILGKSLIQQGLNKDRLRGISSSSASREAPSMCYGFLSPLGNQFVIDDGWSAVGDSESWATSPKTIGDVRNQQTSDNGRFQSKESWSVGDYGFKGETIEDTPIRYNSGFRLRTRNGTQLLISDNGNIYMINGDGSAWLELSDDGHIDCYSSTGINASCDGDINLYSKKNINIEANGKIQMKAGDGINIESVSPVNFATPSINAESEISADNIVSNSITSKVLVSKNAQLQGTFEGTLQGIAYYSTFTGVSPIEQPKPNTIMSEPEKVEKAKINSVQGNVGGSNKETIATRVPTHEPYAGHDRNNSMPVLKVRKKVIEQEDIKQDIMVTNQVIK